MQIDESQSADKAMAWNDECRAHLAKAKEDRISATKALIKK
jgi:hypothetical protein